APRRPVRLLHGRHPDVAHRRAPRQPAPHGARGPRRPRRPPVPLHRLPGHGRRGARARGDRRGTARGPGMSADAPRAAARTPDGGYMGAPAPRLEDARLLTGRGTFVDDLEMPGVVHAAMLRSPHAHARVTRIDAARARALPGVLAVVTAGDIADIQKPWPARI